MTSIVVGEQNKGKVELVDELIVRVDAVGLTPNTTVLAFDTVSIASRNPHASLVQPGVSSFG